VADCCFGLRSLESVLYTSAAVYTFCSGSSNVAVLGRLVFVFSRNLTLELIHQTHRLDLSDRFLAFLLKDLLIDMCESTSGTCSLVLGELPGPQSRFKQLIKLIESTLTQVSLNPSYMLSIRLTPFVSGMQNATQKRAATAKPKKTNPTLLPIESSMYGLAYDTAKPDSVSTVIAAAIAIIISLYPRNILVQLTFSSKKC
jgi:hypothetical protein